MANDYLTVADLVAGAFDVAQTGTSDILNQSPLVARMPRINPSGSNTVHKYRKYTGAPAVGFRSENDGRENDHSEDTVVTVNLKIADFSFSVDIASAEGDSQSTPEQVIAREGARHLQGILFKAEQQTIYGTGADGDANGPGAVNGLLLGLEQDALKVPCTFAGNHLLQCRLAVTFGRCNVN